jgi:hypothetical protein
LPLMDATSQHDFPSSAGTSPYRFERLHWATVSQMLLVC